jgi:hypothetical protein
MSVNQELCRTMHNNVLLFLVDKLLECDKRYATNQSAVSMVSESATGTVASFDPRQQQTE